MLSAPPPPQDSPPAPRSRDTTPASTGRRRQTASAPTAPPRERSIAINGAEVTYILKTSARARRLRLVIRPATGLEVVMPRGATLADVDRILCEKAAWIETTLARMATQVVAPPPPLTDGRVLSYLGEPLRLVIQTGAPVGRFRAALRDGMLTLTVASTSEETVRIALETWYRRQARDIFPERITRCNIAYGFQYGRVSIKDQKSRWGSCSRKGNLNFNWRLLLAPLPVLDYVVYHELAHLKEPNHSPRFWAVVAGPCPEYRERRRWLKQHGHELRF
jgi:predicted metal-dependent hydrolase